ncbi:hypothetical protein GGI25_002241 [Coemansia spiralis]|uniref:GRAM domain-containing protein n=2 Tax=Coemansia TaxID=4863 RepID=A0A9W8KXR1_9FUNG|nr:hypothetical protein BX070DRAFT_105626 [Coemansia spiralis]KAJ1996251.1 hypothetical protein EDC05_000141 [Coemansia umbellata]KAJ2625992.1 hypothetical protein GGI26_000076 [Coemansia sp. RSA 1358]KAJ2678653.1 hypothetical protein GGI25_002241 [Coemansia spiralis]
MALNAVMLERGTRHPVPLPEENFLYHCSGVKLELKSGAGYPGDAVALSSPSGTVFISNKRIIFLPSTTTHENSTASVGLNSFTIPHVNLSDLKFVQPLFGANRFEAAARPVSGGGIAAPAVLTLTFKEGGGFDFVTIARKMSERIQETGEIPPHEEELPVYDGPSAESPAYPGADGPPSYPADAPPGYEQHNTRD